ncbi:helix-turn-helix domain-containing protein [Selenomonas dianae]|nr:helix-turn-helix domain-containing protein [Selenomonas dianae]WLD83259.1 helix-turn-helix domain-containing protein [Selenomonas dianae]
MKEVTKMPTDFDRTLFFDNISYLIKKHDLKIGEIENSAGVSAGYISRASKDEKSKPGVEFVMKIAELLQINVDTLLRADLTNATPTEKYLMSFLGKLNSDTVSDSLNWVRESKEELNRLQEDQYGNTGHPLFKLRTYDASNDYDGSIGDVTQVVFASHNFDCRTAVYRDCYSLRMKNGTLLHLMNICKTYSSLSDSDTFAIEVWMTPLREEPQFLCDNKGEATISRLIDGLYTTVSENMRHPKIDKNIRYVIDAFMKNDLEDDPPVFDADDIPF